jgi:hypothetical protein
LRNTLPANGARFLTEPGIFLDAPAAKPESSARAATACASSAMPHSRGAGIHARQAQPAQSLYSIS